MSRDKNLADTVLIDHRESAAKEKDASYSRYKNAQDYHKYYQGKVQEYSAHLEQLVQSMAYSQRQSSIYSGTLKNFLNKIRQSILS